MNLKKKEIEMEMKKKIYKINKGQKKVPQNVKLALR